MNVPTYADVEAAARRIKGRVARTKLMRSEALDRATGGEIYIKPECLQLTGAFKARGAFSRLTALSDAEKQKGVVAFSSGNHGQAVAYAAKELGIAATIVMPGTAPTIKIEKTRSHGPDVVLYDIELESREEIAQKISDETGATVVPSFEDPYIIAGQGTAALEVIEDLEKEGKKLDAYLVGAGGGGLLAGSVLCFRYAFPETCVYSVEPDHYDDHARSFAANEISPLEGGLPATLCDAIMTPAPGTLTFSISQPHVTGGLTVSEDDVCSAVRFAHEHLGLVVEPGGAVALAAVLAGKIDAKNKAIGLILTGSNIDDDLLQKILKS